MAEEDGKGCDWSWILYAFAWSVFMGLGIFLIIFGYDELATCERSMLPLYILVTGCTMVAGCVLSSLAAIFLLLESLKTKKLNCVLEYLMDSRVFGKLHHHALEHNNDRGK